MNAFEFTHQVFYTSNWEDHINKFIEMLDISEGSIWRGNKEYKKINEELTVLGHYVKHQYGEDRCISFKLNEAEGKADGWVYRQGEIIEAVQIVIAYYEQQESDIDKKIMKGEDLVDGGWVGDRVNLLKCRAEKRITKKIDKGYKDIDTLLIGFRGWFVQRINNDFQDQKADLFRHIEASMPNSSFKRLALVDTDFVGKGEVQIAWG